MAATSQRDEAGMATLEWLLVVAAVGGFAAVMSGAFQALIDDAARLPSNPAVPLIEAGIVAARISDDGAAAQAALDLAADDPAAAAAAQARLDALGQECEALAVAYPQAIAAAAWVWTKAPVGLPPTTTSASPAAETTVPAPTTTLHSGGQPSGPTQTEGRWVCRISHRSA